MPRRLYEIEYYTEYGMKEKRVQDPIHGECLQTTIVYRKIANLGKIWLNNLHKRIITIDGKKYKMTGYSTFYKPKIFVRKI